MKPFTVQERLIVALDFKPTEQRQGKEWVRSQTIAFVRKIRKTGVFIKLESGIRGDYELIEFLRSEGEDVKIMADLKLTGIPETLAIDGAILREFKPEILTVMCGTGIASMKTLKTELPRTEVLGVTVPTHLTKADVNRIHGDLTLVVTVKLATLAEKAGLGGVVCSAKETKQLREYISQDMTVNTPGIRPKWANVCGDDQNPECVMTPAEAMEAGADRIIVGRPITQAISPYDATMRTLDEIDHVHKEKF